MTKVPKNYFEDFSFRQIMKNALSNNMPKWALFQSKSSFKYLWKTSRFKDEILGTGYISITIDKYFLAQLDTS